MCAELVRIGKRSSRKIRFSVLWLLALLALLGVLPLYTLPTSDIPIVWVLLLITDTVAIFILADFYLQSPSFALQLCLFIFVFQNVLIGLLNPTRENPQTVVWLLGYTTLLPVIIISVGVLRSGFTKLYAFRRLHAVAFLYMLYMLFQFISSPWPIAARVPALRNAISVILLFYAGYLRPAFRKRDAQSFDRFMFSLILAVLIFGYVELFLLGDAFWVDWLNIDYVAEVKNLRPTLHSPVPVPSDFYTPIAQRYYRRMASIFATPITLGYFLAYAFFFALYLARSSSRRRLRSLVPRVALPGSILIALFLSLSKGGWQVAGVGFLSYLWIKMMRPRRFLEFLLVLILVGILSTLAGYGLFAERGTTLEMHVQGLTVAVQHARGLPLFVGHSLGSGGTISARLGVEVPFAAERGADNGIGTLLYQTGLLGVFLYLAVMILILHALFVSYRRYRGEPKLGTYLLVVLAANAGLLVNAFFQENALAPIPASPFLISAGVALNLGVTRQRVAPSIALSPRPRLDANDADDKPEV